MTETRTPALTRRRLLGDTLKIGTAAGMASSAHAAAGTARGQGLSAEAAARELPTLAGRLREATRIPGLAWAVVQGERIIAAEGLGVREAGRDAVVDADTTFQLASVSKPLGATVVARQAGEGRISWDSLMQQLLPWFTLRNPGYAAKLTVGDLYAHRSGLPDHAGDLLEELGFGQREALESLRLLPVKPLGSEYAYTNLGLTAAAIAVAGAAGTDWATLSEQTLYQPLEMRRTTSRYADFMAQANRATSHMRADDGSWRATLPRNADLQSPAGGASSSVNDMARWMSLLLGQGRWRGRQLVAATALDAACKPQSPDGKYGFGFNVGSTDSGLPLLSHSGAFLMGAATSFMLLPSLNTGIVVLTNTTPIGVPETLCRQFVDLMEKGRLTRDWWSAYSHAIAPLLAPLGSLLGQAPPATPRPAAPLDRYAGSYGNPYYGPLQVEQTDGGLQLSLGPARQRYRLRHWDGSSFTFEPSNESAPPHSLSLAVFDADGTLPARSVWLEFYDNEGQGLFSRLREPGPQGPLQQAPDALNEESVAMKIKAA